MLKLNPQTMMSFNTNFLLTRHAIELLEYYKDHGLTGGPTKGRVALIALDDFMHDGFWYDVLNITFVTMSMQDAQHVFNFLDENASNCEYVWVCSPNVHKAAAISKFLAEFYGARGYPIKKASYNEQVYNTLVESWKLRNSQH